MKGKLNAYGKGKLLLITIFCSSALWLSGCEQKKVVVQQPVEKISAVQVLDNLKASKYPTEHVARTLLADLSNENKLPSPLAELVKEHPDMSAYMLAALARDVPLEDTLRRGKEYKYDPEAMLELSYIMSSDKQMLTDNLLFSRIADFDTIAKIAINAGLDPAQFLPATASVSAGYRITPLFESASVTIYNREKSDTAKVQYRKVGSDEWLEAMDLHWEPIDGALSGSIVYLTEDTEYEVKVVVTTNGYQLDPMIYQFKTWSPEPPIDPNKIYYLSDIYSGGQLSVKSLGIKGTADAWAKIIGDADHPIVASSELAAVNIGEDNNYIYFENVTIRGGNQFAILSENAHHLWFNGCDISGWGRSPNYKINGLWYEKTTDSKPINLDSAFGLLQTGSVVIENCEVYDPVPPSNNWGSGHPNGPNALLINAYHKNAEYEGQYVLRNNMFYGTKTHRFNDVIESRWNDSVKGGFVRDSAIYNNYFAYANDDIIELDGGQNNVLFYNNEITDAYCGVSTSPNMKGPNYIFNNYIHNMGDDRGETWTTFKQGGYFSRPAGVTNLYYNYIPDNANGIAPGGFAGDNTYHTNVMNNVFVHNQYWSIRGWTVYDPEMYSESQFINNYMFNMVAQRPVYAAKITKDYHDISQLNYDKAYELWNANSKSVELDIPAYYQLPNITKYSLDNPNMVLVGKVEESMTEPVVPEPEPVPEPVVPEPEPEPEPVVPEPEPEPEPVVPEPEPVVPEPEPEPEPEPVVPEPEPEPEPVEPEPEPEPTPVTDIRAIIEQRRQEAMERIEKQRAEALERIETQRAEALERIEQQRQEMLERSQ